jgi:CHC2-type zinc finger protein
VSERVPDSLIERARAVPMPQLVARDRPLKRVGSVWVALCPVHREKTPSFTVWPDHAHCFGCGWTGDPIAYLRLTKSLDFAAAVSELAGNTHTTRESEGRPAGSPISKISRSESAFGGQHGDAPEPSQFATKFPAVGEPAPEIRRLISRLWSGATDPSIARVYLRSRGLPCEPLSEALRGHSAVWCSETRDYRPCVLAAVHASDGRLVALQRIYTRTVYIANAEPDARPLDLATRKKSLGQLGDGAVRLHTAGDRLGLAEGVESASAAGRMYRRPTWAVLGAARYGRPAQRKERPDGSHYRVEERSPSVWIPPGVTDLLIFGDRDGGVGEEAALWAAHWWRRQGLAARAIFPPPGIKDFADALG